tara:strand:+ start:1495 stop:2586 length:1092 start_codon:yes stop_codon:yes gene_type:complete
MGFKSGRGNVTDLDVSGTFKANAGPDGIHQVTGSLHITGSEGANLIIQSRGEVSLRLEADTNNTDDSQNPFIEFIQDGGLTDYTIGLTQLSKNPEGVTVRHIGDNSLAIGANFVDDAIASAATGHVQFYNRLTASFSLIDKGSTNFGDIDRQGFRVGVGPAFSEANFPKGRMEIYNTSLSPCPALVLTVSGTAQPAIQVRAANTNASLIEMTGSALDEGALLAAQAGANGSAIALKVKHVTGAVAEAGDTTTSLAGALPAFSAILAFGIRVTTGYDAHITQIGVTGDSDFFVGIDPTTASASNVLKAGVLEQAGDTAVIPITLANNKFIAGFTDQTLVLTHGASNQGAVRVAVYYYEITPPTS